MAKIEGALELLVRKLESMLYVEKELEEHVLPELLDRVGDPHLKRAVERHVVQTRGHVANLEHALSLLGEEPEPGKNVAFAALVKEHDGLVRQLGASELEDVVHAGSDGETEHFEIAVYEWMIDLAESLGETEIVHLLEENLDQEREALREVKQISTQLATAQATT